MGNGNERTGCGGDILDMDGYCNADVCTAVRCNPKRLVGKSEDSTSMDDTTRIVLTRTVHRNTGITIICLGYLHHQQSGEFTLVERRLSARSPEFYDPLADNPRA